MTIIDESAAGREYSICSQVTTVSKTHGSRNICFITRHLLKDYAFMSFRLRVSHIILCFWLSIYKGAPPLLKRHIFWKMGLGALFLGFFFLSCVVCVKSVEPKTSPTCTFPAIYNFGDSNSDTGGISASFVPIPAPYGQGFFHKPSGRDCDGRLIIDFIGIMNFEIPLSLSVMLFPTFC